MKTRPHQPDTIEQIDALLGNIKKPHPLKKQSLPDVTIKNHRVGRPTNKLGLRKKPENFMCDPLVLAEIKRISAFSNKFAVGRGLSRGDIINYCLKQALPGLKKKLGFK